MKGFHVQRTYDGREKLAIAQYCCLNNLKYVSSDTYDDIDLVPVGTVEWIESIIGQQTPDYYPDFLNSILNREIYYSDNCLPDEPMFVKPADCYKKFDGRIASIHDYEYFYYRNWLNGFFWHSDIIYFTNEWRYYVANGKIISGWWYKGKEEDCDLPAPKLDIKFPKNYCGAVDIGLFDDKVTLVECQHPYGIGWYGEDCAEYATFLYEGWQQLKKHAYIKLSQH